MTYRQLTDIQKGMIIAHHSHGMSSRTIAKEVNCGKMAVTRFLNRYNQTGNANRKIGSGRPSLFSKSEKTRIIELAKQNRKISARTIIKRLKLKSSEQSIRNVIHSVGGIGIYQKKKPFVCERNRLKRLAWAREHLYWDIEQWKRVLWTDESKFFLRYQGRVSVWKFPGDSPNDPKLTKGTVKHDKSVMVWGCFGGPGLGDLHKVKGIMNAKQYHNILQRHMFPSATRLFEGKEWIFQQDNDPKHTAHIIRNYLRNKNVIKLDWPAQSPDLNIIENLWAIFDKRLASRNPQNEDQLFNVLCKAWSKIPMKIIHSLIESMPRRCQAVIDANGYPTKY